MAVKKIKIKRRLRLAASRRNQSADRVHPVGRLHLKALSKEEVEAYIDHRLKVAGYQGRKLFDEGAIDEIYKFSEGIPRLVNAICDRALIKACVSGQQRLDKKLLRKVIQTD